MKKIIVLLVLLFNLSFFGYSQGDTTLIKKDTLSYYDMSLEQLLSLKAHGVPSELETLINSLISVSSKKPINVRETPSIISLVTEEEIKKSGARELIDVLRLVPGFDFGVDIEGVVGIGLRGNWAHEGKILILLDGQEMNETLYGTTQYGNHFPIEQIKKIEIIRGPGSAIYGGFAEFGVINIITRQAEDINGISVSGTYGQMEKGFGRKNVNLSIGKKTKDFSFSVSGLLGRAQRSDQIYKDFADSSYLMNGQSNINTNYVNAFLGYKGLSFRVIGDFYQMQIRDGYDKIASRAVSHEFNSVFSELKYVYKVNNKLTITPKFNYKTQMPWKSPAYDNESAFSKTVVRYRENITATYDANRFLNIVLGAESFQDYATDNIDSSYFSNGKKTVHYYDVAFFTQGLIKTRYMNIILGARYDKHSAVTEDAFVPRIGLTKKYNRFHFKLLYSKSFKAPTIDNISYADSNGIHSEYTRVGEIELGYQITRKSIITINGYNINTSEPIVYYTTQDSSSITDNYKNYGKSGSIGLEAEYKMKDKWGYLSVNYALYSVLHKSRIDDYRTPNDMSLLGFSNHRVNLSANWNITKNLSINATASWYSKRYAVTSLDSLGQSIQTSLNPTTLINCFVRYETPVKGLTVGAGVYDLLNQKIKFIQPYNGGHAPLPGPSREIIVRIQYNLNFKQNTN